MMQEMIYNIEVLKSKFCDQNNIYILIRGNTIIIEHQVKEVVFKNCASFIKCIPKFDGVTIDDAKDLD